MGTIRTVVLVDPAHLLTLKAQLCSCMHGMCQETTISRAKHGPSKKPVQLNRNPGNVIGLAYFRQESKFHDIYCTIIADVHKKLV